MCLYIYTRIGGLGIIFGVGIGEYLRSACFDRNRNHMFLYLWLKAHDDDS